MLKIRKATEEDISAIDGTYTRLMEYEAEHENYTNWKIGVYPTVHDAEKAVSEGTMFILEEGGELCASMILNKNQAEHYKQIEWKYSAEPEEVLVIHTLTVPPEKARKGYGRAMVDFAGMYGKEHGCKVIRMDTSVRNTPAQEMYTKYGFRIAGKLRVMHHGPIDGELYFLEGIIF